MADIIKWPVVMVCPGEEELPLLAELSARRDSRIVAILDPNGTSLGAGLAEIMGLPVVNCLGEVPTGSTRYLVHPPLDDTVAELVDQAPEFELTPHSAREFSELVSGPRLSAPPPARSRTHASVDAAMASLEPSDQAESDLEFLEMETAAIHRTLSRIEEALDREALLRWLLGLATRATKAGSGSIMLLDREAEELYVAFAYGLSQNTLHSARVRLGEGIAGRVARTRRAELICDVQHPGRRSDRASVETSISAPVVWEGKLLGVINVSTSRGETPLDNNSLATLESLTHRFGLILDRFLNIQASSNRELLRDMEEKFTRDTGQPETLATTLCAWAADIEQAAGADRVSLAILTADGDLFTADPAGTAYESPPTPDKSEVLTSGRPRVIRPDETDPEPDVVNEATVFHLPVGRDPQRALLSLEFGAAAAAHHFHTVSSEILLLLNRHLINFLDRTATADQVDRLTTLASALSELGAAPTGPANRERVMAAACRLTGAGQALLLTGDEDLGAPPDDETPEQALRREASRLLSEAGQSEWQTTVMESGDGAQRRTLMAVPLGGADPFPGLVLLDKRRLHPLDGSSFTEFDALFARRLLPLLADRLGRQPELQAVETEALASCLEPTVGSSVSATSRTMAEILLREMDRCDRYHTMLGLAAFRLQPQPAGETDFQELVGSIGRHLRSSDHTGCLEDGTILVIVPEDIQSLPRLLKRVAELLRQRHGDPNLKVAMASRVYPGGGDTAEKLLHSVLNALP